MSRRAQRREHVREALAERRVRRRWIHEAVWARAERRHQLWVDKMAARCRCCPYCYPSPCEDTFLGLCCRRHCRCDEDDDRYVPDDYDDDPDYDGMREGGE